MYLDTEIKKHFLMKIFLTPMLYDVHVVYLSRFVSVSVNVATRLVQKLLRHVHFNMQSLG